MKPLLSYLGLSLLVKLAASLSEPSAPLNVKIHDSHIPQKLANELLSSEEDKNTISPSYELYYIGQPGAHRSDGPSDRYLCEIHSDAEIKQLKKISVASELEQESLAAILQKAMALIHATFPAKSCLYAYDLRGMYWTYALCSGDKIIQYHEGASIAERGKKHKPLHPSTVFVLGRFTTASARELLFQNQASEAQYLQYIKQAETAVTLVDEKSAPFTHKSTQKAVLQIVTDGSVCDMTLQPRTVEVVYKCDADGGDRPSIRDVLEIKTCHYRMFVHVPQLCQYAPFSPDRNSQDSVIDVLCQRIRADSEEATSSEDVIDSAEQEPLKPLPSAFSDYSKHTLLRDHPFFPVRADNRIDIADHYLVALSRGFYFARLKTPIESSSEYVNSRNVVLFSGVYSSLADLNQQFAKTIFNSVGSSLLAPGRAKSGPSLLQWLHSFILWFEVYDFKGELLGISRFEHDASSQKNILKAQFLDPETLLDVEGDIPSMVKFERPDFQAPSDMWNFELFSDTGAPLKEIRGAKKASSRHDVAARLHGMRPIMAYNRGLLENGLVDMELVDQMTGKVLKGKYEDDGHYVFELVDESGKTHLFGIHLMNEDQDFTGFTVQVDTNNRHEQAREDYKSTEEGPENGAEYETQPLANSDTTEESVFEHTDKRDYFDNYAGEPDHLRDVPEDDTSDAFEHLIYEDLEYLLDVL